LDVRRRGLRRRARGRHVLVAGNSQAQWINPQDWLTDVLDKIGRGHPINAIDNLLPWN
jgi:hypothetical protein